MTKTLLIEIGTEELPARLINKICLQLNQMFIQELHQYNIKYDHIRYFSTPRRLALLIDKINIISKPIIIHKKGPSTKQAYDEHGMLTKISLLWAKSCQIDVNDIKILKNKKGSWLSYTIKKIQEKIEVTIPKMIKSSLHNIVLSKSMKWNGKNQRFIRPIRNIVILLDNQIIKTKIFNIQSNNLLHNHIAFKNKKINIQHAQEYPKILFNEFNIIANHDLRKQKIIEQTNTISQKINGFIKNNNSLFDEITNLVESPYAFLSNFEKKFLVIPEKILIYIIEKQQKCFPIYDHKNKLLPYFIFISNINSKKPISMIHGNQRVMHARLADAEFFLENDKKIKLENYLLLLKNVLFYNKLGSLYEKTIRLTKLIEWISQYTKNNKKDAIRAAFLSKCDLITQMVSEFPDLQGTVGMYYSMQDREKIDISLALEEQYLPSHATGILPCTIIGSILSIADKIDTISGMFYVNQIPTPNKDPFALRRLTLGIIRIIIEKKISLDLKHLIHESIFLYAKKKFSKYVIHEKIIQFFMLRLSYWYQQRGYHKKIIQSVLSLKLTNMIDIHYRIKALCSFQQAQDSKSIILSIKRILKIFEKNTIKINQNINLKLFQEKEEIKLFQKIKMFKNFTKYLFIKYQYKEILFKIKDMQKSIDEFFKKIHIHHINPDIQKNRLTLLYELKKIFLKIADFSYFY